MLLNVGHKSSKHTAVPEHSSHRVLCIITNLSLNNAVCRLAAVRWSTSGASELSWWMVSGQLSHRMQPITTCAESHVLTTAICRKIEYTVWYTPCDVAVATTAGLKPANRALQLCCLANSITSCTGPGNSLSLPCRCLSPLPSVRNSSARRVDTCGDDALSLPY